MNLLLIVLALLLVAPATPGTVSVAYAGSLVRVMEGPVATSLRETTGLQFTGEGKGSNALAHLITAGLRSPDVFISADPKLLDPLVRNRTIAGYRVFGSARMVLAYSPNSMHRAVFDQLRRGQRALLTTLVLPDMRIGRTDPRLDPKGARTLTVLRLLGRRFDASQTAQRVANQSGVFPEEDLAVRVETGEEDAGFFYSTEVTGRDLEVIELPQGTNLDGRITYALAILRDAAHPAAAKTFANFILRGPGRGLLAKAGVKYFPHPNVVGMP